MTFLWPTSNVGMLHPAGSRDEPNRWLQFTRMGAYLTAGLTYAEMKEEFEPLSSKAVETSVAALGEVGVLYSRGTSVPLVLTPVGRQLMPFTRGTAAYSVEEVTQITALLAWALSNCQINRPRGGGTPTLDPTARAACDIRPYLATWSLMLDLDGVLHMHEFLGPVRQLQKIADYDACVARIRAARAAGTTFPNPQTGSPGSLANASIYWRSRLSVAGKLLHFNAAQQRLEFAPGGEAIVEAVLEAQGSSNLDAIRARPWSDVESYFAFAGAACSAEVTGAVIDALTAPPAPAPDPAGPQGPIPPIPGGSSSAEGRRRYRLQSQIERRYWVSREAKRLNAAQHEGKVTCEACGFGHPDAAMMDAHHEQPLAGGVRDTRIDDLRILCPTCHRRAHRSADPLIPFSLADLQAWVADGKP
jgi:hypothetical protein